MIFPKGFLICINLLLIKVPSSEESVLQGYNESCELYDETSSCDDTLGLMCIDSGMKGYKCKCPTDKQFGTVWNGNRCVGKVFNSCVRGRTSTGVSGSISGRTKSNNNNETFCVENAECNTSVYYLPICLCKKGFFETDEGTCAPVAEYGQPCDNDKAQCDSKYGLSCQSDGKCGCNNTSNSSNVFYDSVEKKCIIKIGGNCSLDENLCIPNAECVRVSKFPGNPPPLPPTTVRRRTIIFASGEAHQNNQNSDISFSTKKGRDPPIRYGGGSGTVEDTQGKCMCKSGFSQTKDGFCMKSYGNVCTKMMERNSTEICNTDQYLECLDAHDGHFRCQCRNPLNERWDEAKKQCVSVIGRRCRPFPSYPKCEEGAECLNDVCVCKRGTSLTPVGGCKLDYNERCLPGECNVYNGLMCHGKTASCLCLDSYLKYDAKKKACVATIGSFCGNVNVIGFPGNIFANYRVPHGGIPNDNTNVDAAPFIECEDGATCTTQIAGKRMSYICTSTVKLLKL